MTPVLPDPEIATRRELHRDRCRRSLSRDDFWLHLIEEAVLREEIQKTE